MILPKISEVNAEQYSFMSGADSDHEDNIFEEHDKRNETNNENHNNTLSTPPPLYNTEDYKIDGMQFTPQLVKSLMHKRVIKISSGGVHNICIVEPRPFELFS